MVPRENDAPYRLAFVGQIRCTPATSRVPRTRGRQLKRSVSPGHRTSGHDSPTSRLVGCLSPDAQTSPVMPATISGWRDALNVLRIHDGSLYAATCTLMLVCWRHFQDSIAVRVFKLRPRHQCSWQPHAHRACKIQVGFTLKNHKERTIPIPAELVKLLNEHRQTADPDCTVLFPNTKGSRPTVTS